MQPFSLDEYLQTRAQSRVQLGNKLDEITRAREQKVAELSATSLAKRDELEPKSWATSLGLGESGLGQAVNIGASLVSGASRVAGDILSLPGDAVASLREATVTPAQFEAYNRVVSGKARPEDHGLLNVPVGAASGGLTVLDQIKEINSTRGVSKKIDEAFDISSIIDKRSRSALSEQLQGGFDAPWEQVTQGWANMKGNEKLKGSADVVSGLAQLLFKAGEAAVNNPQAAAEYIAENLPQLAIGLAGKAGKVALGASNVGYAAENYRKGIENYQAENNGAFPPVEQRQYMAMMAASTGAVEWLGDASLLKSATAAADVARAGFKNSVMGVAQAGVKGVATEALTEGYQTFAEGEATNKPASAADIYEGATIGGIAGGGLAAGMKGLASGAEAAVASAVKQIEEQGVLTAAATTGDVSALVDPASPNFNLEAVISAMQAFAARDTATREEHKQARFQAMTALNLMEEQSLQMEAQTPQGRRVLEKELASVTQELAATDPADKATMDELIAERDQLTKRAELPVLAGKDLVKHEANYKTLTAKLNTLNDVIGGFKAPPPRATPDADPADNFQTNLAAASAKVDLKDTAAVEQAQASATRVINLSMQSPDALSPEVALSLADDTDNALSPAQRQHLRVFSEAQVAANQLKNMKRVSQEVYFGDEATKQVGIVSYQTRLATALEVGNQPEATRQLKGITKFLASHSEKAVAVREAFKLAQKTPTLEGFKVERTQDGEWTVSPVAPGTNLSVLASELAKNGGARIHKGSEEKFVIPVEQEAQAIKLAQTAMKSAIALTFNPGAAAVALASPGSSVAPAVPVPVALPVTPQPGVSNVTDVPQQVAAPAAPAQSAQKAPAAAVVATASPVQAAAVVPGTGTARVEAPRVIPKTQPVEAAKPVEVEEAQPTQADAQAAVAETTDTPKAWLAPEAEDNLLRQVQQQVGNEKQGTIKPLASIPDFVRVWKEQGAKALEKLLPMVKLDSWVPEKKALARKALKHARDTVEAWKPDVAASLPMASTWKKLNQDFRQQDMAQFFATGEDAEGRGVVPDNVLTAIIYASYQWTNDQANGLAYLDPKQVTEMHKRPENTKLGKAGYNELRKVVAFEDTVISDLGEVALQALGIKATKNTPADFIPRLQNALGTHALLLLEKRGIIVRQSMQTKQVAIDLFEEDGEGIGPAAVNAYVLLVREKDFSLAPEAQAIKEANKGSGGVVDMLFGSNKASRFALTEKTTFTQKFAKGTQQTITKKQAKALQQAMDAPHTVIPEMLDLFMSMGRESVLKVAGWVDLANTPVHAANLGAIEAQNQNLEQQYDLAMEMMGLEEASITPLTIKAAKEHKGWFITHEVWRNYRVGIATQSLNQQTSKIHRYLFERPNWKATIDLSNQRQVNRFLISMGQNLGFKTDKQSNAKSVKMIQAKYMAEGTAAAKAADVIREGNWTDENRALVADFAAKEGVVALQALQALAKYQAAKASGAKSFEVTLLVGADGKTNGPILTHLALGAAATLDELKGLLRRGGMFFKGDSQKHYSQFAEEGGQDLYQDLSAVVQSRAALRITTQANIDRVAKIPKTGFTDAKKLITQEQFDAFQVVSGQLTDSSGLVSSAGRNLVKTPLTAFAFGSSLVKATKSMEDAFVQTFYDTIQGIARGDSDTSLEELITAMNVLLKRNGGELLNVRPDNRGLDLELNKAQLKALHYTFDSVMGGPVKEAMESYFATFIQRRGELNRAIGASFDLYQVAYQAAKAQMIERLMDSGKLDFTEPKKLIGTVNGKKVYEKTGERKPKFDLSVAQEQELQELLGEIRPVLHTDFSLEAKDISAGMLMVKSTMKMSDEDAYLNKVSAYTRYALDPKTNKEVIAQGGVSVPDTQALRDGPDKVYDNLPMTLKPHLGSRSRVRVEVSPGVAGTPGAIHSSDSAGMHKSLLSAPQAQGLNVHDEVNTSPEHIEAAAQAINEATVDTFMRYSPAAEARDMMERQLKALNAAVKAGTLPASVVQVVGKVWADTLNAMVENKQAEITFTPAEALTAYPSMVVRLAYEADTLRLGAMAEMEVMDQYTWEGGQFDVTDALRAEAQAKLAALPTEVPAITELAKELAGAVVESDEAAQLLRKVEALRKSPEAKQDAKEDPIDRTPAPKTPAALGAPGVMAPSIVEALDTLPPALKQDVAEGTPVIEALNKLPTDERIQATEQIAKAASSLPADQFSPWGELGETPAHRHHAELVKFLSERGQVSALEIYPVLKKLFAESSMNQGMVTLLDRVVRLAGPDFKIQYVTKDTRLDQVLEAPGLKDSRGWYVAHKSGQRVAYILGQEFSASAVHAEVVMHEMLHEVLSEQIEHPKTLAARKLVSELQGLLVEVRKHPDAKKFGNATADVHELVSWGMTNRKFQAEVLSTIQVKDHTNKGNRLISGMQSFIKTLRAFFFKNLDTANADKATNALTVLLSNTAGLFQAVAEELASTGGVKKTIEQNRSQFTMDMVRGPLDKFNLGVDTVERTIDRVKDAAAGLANSDMIKNSRFGPVKLAGSVVNIVAKDLSMRVLEVGLNLRDQVVKDRQGFVAGMLNSLQGPAEFARGLLRMAKKNEKIRKQMIEETANMVMAGFRDGARMSDKKKAAVTKVFLRSGLHVLLGNGMTLANIQGLMDSPAVLQQAIDDKVAELSGFRKTRHFYIKQAKALAYVKVAGTQRIAGGMLNAGNIARLYGTPLAGSVEVGQALAAEKTIEALVALYSLQYTPASVLGEAKAVLDDELARSGRENGIEQVLLLHKEMDRQAREKLFKDGGEDALRTHGYTAEIYNPNTALRTAKTPEDRKALKDTGFTLVMALPKDQADPDQADTYLYSLKDGGSLPFLTGATSLKGLAAKGNAQHEEAGDPKSAKSILQAQQAAIADLFRPDPNWDPRKAKGTYLTPVMNAKGEVANWRYLMSEANKDDLLKRDNRVEYVLGSMAGSTFDKESSRVQNQDVVQSLYEMHQLDFKKRPKSYVEVSPNSRNAEMRELYRILPDTMQKEIKEVWGEKPMMVPYELLDVIFGYRKLSAAKPFDKMAANRLADAKGEDRLSQDHMNMLEEAVVMGTELALYNYALAFKRMSKAEATTWSRAAGVRVRRTEKAWQEIVQEIKDTIVVRGITTMIGNIKSNISFLLIHGINPATAFKDTKIAWKGAVDYKMDRTELAQLETQLAAGYTLGEEQAMRRRVVELKASIQANPVRELIEGGLLPVIVEDVATDFDPYSYKSLLAKKSEKLVNKINPGVRTAGRWIYMTHDTQAYKTLSQITQLSDFTARYVLFKHLTTRTKNPLSKVDAIEEASESFVNYDIPMHRAVQYLDDMGITMFTKYYLNIQRVLLKLAKDKPIQVLIAAALHQYFGRMDLVIESGLPYRLGVPSIKDGPLEAFGALGQLPAVMLTDGLLGNSSGGDWPQ